MVYDCVGVPDKSQDYMTGPNDLFRVLFERCYASNPFQGGADDVSSLGRGFERIRDGCRGIASVCKYMDISGFAVNMTIGNGV